MEQIVEKNQIAPTSTSAAAQASADQAERLIAIGLSNSASMDTIERLIKMRNELNAERAKQAFFAALSSFQGDCPVIPKTKIVKNKDGSVRYSYAPLDEIASHIAPLLGKHGLSYRIETKMTTTKAGNGADQSFLKAICHVYHSDGHCESSDFDVPVMNTGYMNHAQEFASAATFAKRQAVCNALGIITGDDDDDDKTGGNLPPPPRPAVAPKMAASAVADHLSAIEAAATLEDLERVYKAAYVAASKVPDKEALQKFVAKKDDRKAVLQRGGK